MELMIYSLYRWSLQNKFKTGKGTRHAHSVSQQWGHIGPIWSLQASGHFLFVCLEKGNIEAEKYKEIITVQYKKEDSHIGDGEIDQC